MRTTGVVLTLALVAPPAAAHAQSAASVGDWSAYGHDASGSRFSPSLDQIDSANVARLRLAWVYRTGDLLRANGRFEATPLMIGGILYVSSPLGRVSALDPVTGAERWTYDPHVDLARDYGDLANRGVSSWLDLRAVPGAACARRVYISRSCEPDSPTGSR